MAEQTGLEPATFRVTGGRSNQLSYCSNSAMPMRKKVPQSGKRLSVLFP